MSKRETKVDPRPLVDEKLVPVSPYLAERFGFSGALMIQSVHFWCEFNRQHDKAETHFRDGRWWMHQSRSEWAEELPGLNALSSISRLNKRLKADGILITQYEAKGDRLWYTLDYQKLAEKIPDHLLPKWLRADQPLPGDSEQPDLPFEPVIDSALTEQIILQGWWRRAQGCSGVTLLGWERRASGVVASRSWGSSVALLGWERHAPGSTLYIDLSVKDSVEEPVEEPVAAAVFTPHPVNEKLYCDNIGDLPPLLLQKLIDLETMFGVDLVKDCIEEAVMHKGRTMAYLEQIIARVAVEIDFAKNIANGSSEESNEKPDLEWYDAQNEGEEPADRDKSAENLPPVAPLSEAPAVSDQPHIDDVLPGQERLTPRVAWVGLIGQLKLQLSSLTYDKWIRELKLVSFADGALTVEARSEPARSWLESRMDLFDIPIRRSGWNFRVVFVGPQEAALAGRM